MPVQEVKDRGPELIMLIEEMCHSRQNIQHTYNCFAERIQQISKQDGCSRLDSLQLLARIRETLVQLLENYNDSTSLQYGGILVLNQVEDPENYSTYFVKIDGIKFRHKVVPGDTLVFKLVKIAPIRRGIVTMRGYAFVGKTLVCEVGEFMAQVAKTKK